MSKPSQADVRGQGRERPTSPSGSGGGAGCRDVQRLLLEALSPGDLLDGVAEAHLEQCARCRALRAQLQLVDGVTREQAPELPAGFELSLRRRLREHRAMTTPGQRADEQQPAAGGTRRRSRAPIVLAAAAVVLVAAGVVTLAARWQGGTGKVTFHRLHLAVQATQDCEEMLFDVELPEGVKPLPGLPEAIGRDRSLRWRSPLRAGANDFDLPLLAQHRRGEVQVRLRLGDKTWTSTVSLAAAQGRAADGTATDEVRLALLVGPDPEGQVGGGHQW
jgi:hypothetical protein